MPQFDVDTERINVFHIDDEYLFTHFFDRTDLFDEFQEYYNDEEYRFEIPAEAIDDVRERLSEEYFNPVVIEDPEPYCVVKEKYTRVIRFLSKRFTPRVMVTSQRRRRA